MVDREARNRFAELVRHLASGRITEKDFDNALESLPFSGKDRIFEAIFDETFSLNATPRRDVVRWILFLQTEEEYRWPKEVWEGSVFLITAFLIVLLFALFPETPYLTRCGISIPLVVGWLYYECWQLKRADEAGDTNAWPFLHQADLDEAVRHPKLLNGTRR